MQGIGFPARAPVIGISREAEALTTGSAPEEVGEGISRPWMVENILQWTIGLDEQ
jgi:hypothetical protein